MKKLLILTLTVLLMHCAHKQDKKDSDQIENFDSIPSSIENSTLQDQFFKEFTEFNLPIEEINENTLYNDGELNRNLQLDQEEKTFFRANYFSYDKDKLLSEQIIKLYPNYPFRDRFQNMGFNDLYGVGIIKTPSSSNDLVIMAFEEGDPDWYVQLFFLLEFSKSKKLVQHHFIAGNINQIYNGDPEDPDALPFYSYKINGSVLLNKAGNIIIQREIIEEGEERDEIISQKAVSVIVEVK